ncbi:phosphosulfolactate synthase [Ferroplasma sp. Type II]|uniref:phosphosulfolactate synthase n=1 Tax=Ferroplasma sp. Type II TaxID=261388 RepID=UPI0025BA3CB3|nr:phosphosulfolactate synthase [Ferroplasma sp. Type II]
MNINRLSENIINDKTWNSSMGKNMLLDKLSSVDMDVISSLRERIYVMKIGWTTSMLLDEKTLINRIKRYRGLGIDVSPGGTTLEIAYAKGHLERTLSSLLQYGFSHLEISEGVIDLPDSQKKKIVDFAKSNNIPFTMEVGKKSEKNQLSLDETIEGVNRDLEYEPDVVIVEGRETGKGVGVFDIEGLIKWDWVTRLAENFPIEKLMFEAPVERQQVELVIRMGNTVNLGNIAPASLAALETQRLGLRGDTFGIPSSSTSVEGPPSNKFIYYVISDHGPLDQAGIMDLTGLNRKTVQNALKELVSSGIVRESFYRNDLRKRIYSASSNLR